MSFQFQRDIDFPFDLGGDQRPPDVRPFVKWGLVALALIVLFVLLSVLKTVYTDLLWFSHLGYRDVYLTVLVTRVAMFLVGVGIMAGLLGLNMYLAHRLSSATPRPPLFAPELQGFMEAVVKWSAVAGVGLIAVIFGAVASARWETVLTFMKAVPFGQTDPLYGRDLAFYIFTLPLYHLIQGWLLGAAIVALLSVAALYMVHASLRGGTLLHVPGAIAHLSVLGALVMFVLAWGHWLDRWELLLSEQGAVFGAAYTDIHARKPALLILTIIAAASGILMLVNAYMGGLRLVVGATVLWMVMAAALGGLWPALMQQFTVTPNEFVREAPYIAHNIRFTRSAFALDRIEEQFYAAEASLDPEEVARNPQTVNNIRLWDYRPLRDVYRQIQLIRPYYEFIDVDVDRYFIGGKYRQVLLAVREVAPEKLDPEAQTWVNRKLFYTHGFGIAMSPVTDFTPEGRPRFFAKDIPSDGVIPIRDEASSGEPDLLITNPRVYYGENTLDYVIVSTKTDELDYQTKEGDLFRTRYFGTGGVRLSSLLRRLAYAWQFADINILISGEITGDSRIQYRRQVQERIETVAPFLTLDSDPYIVAADGQLYWIQDAYTVTDRYPYSDPYADSFNYIRNSVKVTVDAFNGTLRFYISDPTDPLIQTYRRIFPDLFLDLEEMPPALRQHIRYPVDFFLAQARQYAQYHMRDPQTFYNSEDLWTIPNEKFGQGATLQPIEPYYVIMKIPGEEREEFVLLLPYTPSQRKNLIGWLAARSDGDNYGKLIAFNFPKDRQIDGPEQIEARIDNDQFISQWFTLRCQEGSFCIRGNLLVIPIDNSLLYAEPVYLQAEGVEFPELKKVILATGERVVMEDSVDLALASLLGPSAVAQAGPTPREGGTGPQTPAEQVGSQLEALESAIRGLKESLAQLEAALEKLRELMGGTE